MITMHDLVAVLQPHHGARNGISASDLLHEMGLPNEERYQRELRGAVQDARERGWAICGTPDEGYYVAETAEELDRTCLFLYSRAMTSLKQIAAMKGISMPDLRGQLRLPT